MKKTTLFKMILLAFVIFTSLSVSGQILISSTGSYSQDFNSLASSGTGNAWVDNSTIANWYSQRTGSGTTYNADTGSSNSGGLYSYGSVSSTDRALGCVGSGNATAGNFAHGVLLKNSSSSTVSDIKVSFTGEQWRCGGATSDVQNISFYYKISASSFTSLNPNNTTGWTAVAALNFTSPIIKSAGAALDGNQATNKVSLVNISIPSLNLPVGSYIMLKWDDPDQTNSDHGLAIDDVNIAWTVPNPTISVTETSITDLNGSVGESPATSVIHVAGTELSGDISFSFSGAYAGYFSTDPVTLSPTSGTVASTEVTVKYTPLASGTHTTTLTVSSPGATSVNIPITAKAISTAVHTPVAEPLKVYAGNNKVMFSAKKGESVKIFNSIGQVILNKEATEGLNEISVTGAKGLHIVKVGNKTAKIIL